MFEAANTNEKVSVNTFEGPIFGFCLGNEDKKYNIFKGIPYAKPPLGKLRFLPPSPLAPWTEVIDCTKTPPTCWQCGIDTESGSEDCLYVNVATPQVKPGQKLPVMFWVGNYSYAFSMDNILDPSLLLDQDIIFVTCGYRLGPFGFLSINDVTAPGNIGLKDIVMAMKWVQRNIEHFGGDTDNVTLIGNSSGGAMIHLMMLSTMTTGLFHKAIIQSASALNSWALVKNPSPKVLELAKELGITTSDKFEVIEALRNLEAKDIMKAFFKLSQQLYPTEAYDSMFKPCIEDEFEGQQAFLTKSPQIILKSGNFNKVPLIIGSNNIEGSLLQYIKDDFYNNYEEFNENACLLVPRALAGEINKSKHIGHQLIKFYMGGEESLKEENKAQYLQLISDCYFLYYVNKAVKMHSEYGPESPVYYYILNYAGDWQVPKKLSFFNSLGHSAEIPYIFQIQLPDQPIVKGSHDSIRTRKRVVKMWTNFAKYSNPTPDDNDPLLQITWDPVENKDRLSYLSIGSELTKGRNPFFERMAFWDQLHNEHAFIRILVHFNELGVYW